MSRFVKLGMTATITGTLLSGCATKTLWSGFDEGMPEEQTLLQDKLVALGKPTKPIAQYPHALALVGTQHDYLLTSGEQDPAILKNIFDDLDPKYLHLTSDSNRTQEIYDRYLYKTEPLRMYINITDQIQNRPTADINKSGFNQTVTVVFDKSEKQVSKKEKALLAKYGFNCQSKSVQVSSGVDEMHTHCGRETKVNLTPIQKTVQNHTLEHKFKRPVMLEVVHYQAKPKSASMIINAGVIALTPITIAIDVVTLPVTIAFCSLAWC